MVKSDFNTKEKIYQVLSKFDQEDLEFEDTMGELLKVFEEELNEENNVDRVKDWDEFANYMHRYIEDKTVSKYGKKTGIDLISVTNPDKCVWNLMKYVFRLYNGQGKRYDLEKIIHYAQMSVILSGGDLTECGVRESENPNRKFWLDLEES